MADAVPDLPPERRAAAAGGGAHLAARSRLPVRRRRLRSRRRASAAALRAWRDTWRACAQPRGTAHPQPARRRALVGDHRRARARQRRRRPVRLPAGYARRRVRPQPRSASATSQPTVFAYSRTAPGDDGRAARAGGGLHHGAGHALGTLRHQVHGAAGQRAAAPAGGGGRRGRGHPAARRMADGRQRVGRARRGRRRDPDAAAQPPAAAGHDARPMLELVAAHAMPCRSAPVSEAALRGAEEIWLSSPRPAACWRSRGSTAAPVGDGRPGPVWRRMRAWSCASWQRPPTSTSLK